METYIAFVGGWTWFGHRIKLSITQVVNSFGLGHLTKQQFAFPFGVVSGSGWDLLGELGCIIGEGSALRSNTKHHLGSLPIHGLMVVGGSGDVAC